MQLLQTQTGTQKPAGVTHSTSQPLNQVLGPFPEHGAAAQDIQDLQAAPQALAP